MKDKDFDALVEDAVKLLPKEFGDILDNVNIFVADLPSRDQMLKMRRKGVGGLLLGLYEGIPQTKRGRGYGVGGNMPDRITIFKLPILRVSRNAEDVKVRVVETVLHEIGHHFGMSEDEIADAMEKTGY